MAPKAKPNVSARTTIRINEELMRRSKTYAASQGMTLTALIEQSLREKFARAESRKNKKVKLPSFKMGFNVPVEVINNNAAMLDIMDELDATD